MNTVNFKTKTKNIALASPSPKDYWVVGLDIGYSAVKGMSPNKAYSFPAYARKIPERRTIVKAPSSTDIRYRDNENGEWVVGALAYDEVNASEVVDSESELFGRNRYYSSMFLVLSRVGIAIGMMGNGVGEKGNKILKIQTGLPPKYEKQDTPFIKERLAGHHSFDIKVGKKNWEHIEYFLTENDIFVMPQPMGALISASIDKNGKNAPEAAKYFSSNIIIFDPGFGTVDDYTISKGTVISAETLSEFGMREIFDRTCKDIYAKCGKEILIPDLQNYLERGELFITDKKAMKRTSFDFSEILFKNCKDVCMETIEKMKSIHDYFSSCDYIIAAGGTYEAWAEEFNEVFKNMEGLKIVPGNVNDMNLSNIFSNVRGYYFYLANKLRK